MRDCRTGEEGSDLKLILLRGCRRRCGAAEEFSDELGSVLTLRQGIISAARRGRTGGESELRRAEQLRPGRGTLPGDSLAHSHGTHKSRALAGAEDAAGCGKLVF